MQDLSSYIRLDNDKWEDVGKVWFVQEYCQRENSTAVELTLKDSSGIIHKRVVAKHQIEWIEE